MHKGMRIHSDKNQKWDMARNVSAEDKKLRETSNEAMPHTLRSKAAQGFRSIGVNFTKSDLDDYVSSVLDGRDYRFIITF
ncbi:hypothetical protein [Bifidobacterium psychraerophilum]|uniref:Uncharacterized protein n=1 Tax=Bifidobacterium psychraerophilum TaxID=218140 RepID=A0A087CLT1_9BIFI|nr:hypothetical protein [Bifidobacterium psychraerophilum]KFI84231.1 hypothetical protein BPSY_0109 [Bifidobacterium psychraerophilum]PKA94088.1 hypothetical protein A9A89_0264 [Bifidobacterium psychraerophilum DSM 22366]